jgi:hypothetical protein
MAPINPRRIAQAILRCYPPAWRKRYAEEVRTLLAETGVGWRQAGDLARGALHEWVTPRGYAWPTASALNRAIGAVLVMSLAGGALIEAVAQWLAAQILLAGVGVPQIGMLLTFSLALALILRQWGVQRWSRYRFRSRSAPRTAFQRIAGRPVKPLELFGWVALWLVISSLHYLGYASAEARGEQFGMFPVYLPSVYRIISYGVHIAFMSSRYNRLAAMYSRAALRDQRALRLQRMTRLAFGPDDTPIGGATS